ncbi:MAG: galactitol-1-phosphate 5-dehydrogenase [Chloroflexota bacterium]
MKALVYTAPHAVEIQKLPDPHPGPGDVVVQVASCGICGSDVHGFQGRSRIRVPPMVMGHEFVGRIASIGALVTDLEIGRRVVVQPIVGDGTCAYCRGGRSNICPGRQLIGGHRPGAFAEFVNVPARMVYPIPHALADAAAALVEPVANAVHMVRRGGREVYGNVVVLGAGTLGLVTSAMAHLSGARHVVVTDTDPHRLAVARRLGADVTLNASDSETSDRILETTDGGADLVIEAVGVGATRRQAITVARPGATVVLLGNLEADSELPVLDVVNKELDLKGSYGSDDGDFRTAIAVLADGKIETASWVETIRLESGQEYFERLTSSPGALVKAQFSITA